MKIFKRDIRNAFKRASLHPEHIAIFCHQLEAQASGLNHDATVGGIALPFGFAASPAIFAMGTDAIQRAHRRYRARDGSWSGWEARYAEIFVGDAIFVEAAMGNILPATVNCWKHSFRGLFGHDIINEENVMLEGSWNTKGFALGFEIDTEAGAISVPPTKVEGARNYIMSGEFVVGSQHVSLKAMQTLRGYMQHWLAASMVWASCIQPLDLLLTYGSEGCQTPNCSNYQIWAGFSDMLSLLRTLARGEAVWPTLFVNSLPTTLALRRRFSGPRVIEEVSWVTTDAAPELIGSVDWRSRTYIRVNADETTKDYVEQDGPQSGITDKHLMRMAIGGVDGFGAHPGAVLFIGVDNLNAVDWVIEGMARGKFARKLLITFFFWCVQQGIEVVVFYLRTNRNITAGEITRLEERCLAAWGGEKGVG